MRIGLIRCLAVIVTLCSLLTACESVSDLNPFGDSKIGIPKCPSIKFLKDADKIITYKPGASRDISDIAFEAEITGFDGECEYFGDNGSYDRVVLTLKVSFDIIRGPAAKTPNINLSYFVAIPEFFPNPKGKVNFNRVLKNYRDNNSMSFVDEPIEIVIPLNKERRGPETRVLIGFNLSKQQLQFNREIMGRRGLGG